MRRSLRGCLLFTIAFLAALAALNAGGSPEARPPEVVAGGDKEYISPSASPGVQDTLIVPITAFADSSRKMVIKEYRLTISDASGRVVREWTDKDKTAPGAFTRFLARLGLMKNDAVSVPKTIEWDGRSTGGTLVPDGIYTYVLEAWDDAGVSSRSSPKKIVVDNTPPKIEIVFDYRIFSPDGDGSRDTLPVGLKASEPAEWKAAVRNAEGGETAGIDFGANLPPRYLWSGEDENGSVMPDGEYRISLSGVDRAGNSTTAAAEPVVVDTKPRAFSLLTDAAAFSPNGDGLRDELRIFPEGFVLDRLLEGRLEVLGAGGEPLASFPLHPSFAEGVPFGGRDAAGLPLPDGLYRFRASALYENGASAEAVTKPVALDTAPPKIAIRSSLDVFSPDGDGIKDYVDLLIDASEAGEWKVTAEDGRGGIADEYEVPGILPRRFRLDRKAPDGVYTVFVSGRDAAGNRAESNRVRIIVDTGSAVLLAAADGTAFSPNGDGVRDRISIIPRTSAGKKTEAYSMEIKNDKGSPVRTIRAEGQIPAALPWDGRDDEGKIAPDGLYTAGLRVLYVNGKSAEAATETFTLDTRSPEAEVRPEGLAMELLPDGSFDGIFVAQSTDAAETWTGEFVAADTGAVLARKFWKERAADFRWDGRGDDGRVVPDGRYTYRLTGEDSAGNKRVFSVSGITMKTLKPTLSVVPSLAAFSPDGNGILDSITFDLGSSVASGISSWRLDIERKGGGAAASIAGDPGLPRSVVWSGRDDNGQRVPDGTYSAIFTVDYGGGKTFTGASVPFQIDTAPPEAEFRVKPALFSPDEDGKDDVLSIELLVKDKTPVDAWSVRVRDSKGGDFALLSGVGKIPAKLTWDGRGSSGELVQQAADYTLDYTVRDVLGNEARGEAPIVVDVLVYPGRRGKIRTGAIQFSAWEADLLQWSAWHRKRNVAVLDEVAAMLKRFPAYRVRLEGHAVSMLSDGSIESEHEHRYILLPLSLSRSDAVRLELLDRGIADSRIEVVGLGGDDPVVPFSDERMRWVNRRVEFYLIRN